jgi:hypothetical protein
VYGELFVERRDTKKKKRRRKRKKTRRRETNKTKKGIEGEERGEPESLFSKVLGLGLL